VCTTHHRVKLSLLVFFACQPLSRNFQTRAFAQIGMPIFTSDGLLIGQVTGIEFFGSNRCLVAAIGGLMGFGPRSVCIPLNL
jgi:hypothetical protein